MLLKSGDRLGVYIIEDELGSGGMGEVYSARDDRLRRIVAIKLLRPGHAAGIKERILHEGRAASALSHPNIVSIYDVGCEDGRDFLVMECLAGTPLQKLIPVHGLALKSALDYATQIASAMNVAHGAGIVHRDLKPANVMVGTGGLVKVLDFGLAKAIAPPIKDLDETGDEIEPDDRSLVGTAAYLSPEQALGEKVDARSDIFAFGCVFYEMLAGVSPFARDSAIASINAVIREEPPRLRELKPDLPHEVEKIVHRCLQKDPNRRFQTAADLKVMLQEQKEESESRSRAAVPVISPASKGTSRRVVWAGVAALAGLAIIAGGAIWYQRSRPSRPVLQPTESLLFSAPEFLAQPNLSPDGNQVAFTWDGRTNGYTQIYLKVVGSGEPLRLTNGNANALSPVWSRDGAAIAYTSSNGDNRAILPGARVVGVRLNHVVVISALGGAAREVFSYEGELTRVSWSADGRALFIPDGKAVYIVSVSDREKRKILDASPGHYYISSILSPDGHTLALIETPEQTPAPTQVYLQNVGTDGIPQGALHQLPISQRLVYSVSWTADSKALVFSGATYLEAANLWRFTINGELERRLENMGTGGASPSIVGPSEGHRGRMVYWHIFDEQDIWKVSREKGKPLQTTPLIASSYREWDPRYSPDGTKIAFSSDRSGGSDIWVSKNDGTEQTQITNVNGMGTSGARWSPDGKQIAFLTKKDGQSEIYTIDAQGGTLVRITNNPAHDTAPLWSPDGRWIYFASNRTGRFELWRMASDGKGDAEQVTQKGGYSMIFASDGRAMYYTKWNLVEGIWKELIDGMPSGEESRIIPIPLTNWANFDVNRDGIAYVPVEQAPAHIYFRRFSDGITTTVGEIIGTPFGISLSPLDGSVLFSQVNKPRKEIVLVENFH